MDGTRTCLKKTQLLPCGNPLVWSAKGTTHSCLARIPACLGTKTEGDEVLLVWKTLTGPDSRAGEVRSIKSSEACVRWLAAFHVGI